MKKRVLSLFLALTLCLTLLPTAVFAGDDGSGTSGVARVGNTEYETLQEILEEMKPVEITLLDDVTEDITVYAETTINMGGFRITGNIEAYDSLTLKGGTVDGSVKVDGGIFTITAPETAEAAITKGLNVVSGSAYVSGAKVGVKISLTFDGDNLTISGSEKAVDLVGTPSVGSATIYGSTDENGDATLPAEFSTENYTYTIYDSIAKKISAKNGGSSEPETPVTLTITPTGTSVDAGETATFTVTYDGADTLEADIQKNALDENIEAPIQKNALDENIEAPILTNNNDGTYTITVKVAEEAPSRDYTLHVYEKDNTSVKASASIHVTGKEPVAEVIRAGESVGTYTSLPTALDKAQDGDTVKLLADHVTDADALNALGEDFTFEQYASIVPVVTKALTLDLNHKTVDYLEVGFTETNEETQKKETLATGNLTVTGEAAYGRISNLMFMAGALDIQSGEIGGSGCAGLLCDANSGSVTVSNGTVYGLTVLEGASVTVNGGSKHAGEWVVASGATLNITDGTFGEVQFTRNGTIAISGGTFKSIKSYIAEELQPLMSLLDTQKVHAFYKGDDVQDGNATELTDVTVKEHTHTMVNNKCACGASIIASVKTADGTERTYGSFTDALAAAVESNDSTLQLLYDIDLGDTKYGVSVDSGKFTLDLNSKTLSGKVDYQLLTVSGTADITIKNGKLVNTFSNDSSAMNRGLANAIQITGGTAVLENVEVTSGCGENGEHTDAVCLSDGNLTVANGTFTGAILVMPKTADQHPVLKITSATLHNGIGYFIWNTSNPDYDGVKALFADGSLLFDEDGNYIDITNTDYWQTDSSEEESFTATIFAYGEECSVKPHTHTIVNGKCSVCGEVEGDGCIAHAVWSPYADYPQWRTTHIKTMDELREKITSPGTKWLDFDNNATVTFLCDVTVDKTFLIDNYYTNIIIDLNGHTLSGALDGPVITANFVSGTGTIDFKNGKIVNTGNGEAIRLAKGKVTLKNVDVTGDLSLTYDFVNSLSYIPTFLGGGSFTKICTVNDAGVWQKYLEDMLPKGYYFADITSGKRVSQTVLTADSPLENVTVKPCNHKNADGKSTFTYKPERQTYYYCSICGNICPHEHRTELADGKLHCEDCNLTLTAARRDSKNTITYYIDMSDAFGNAYQPIIWPLCDQTCTQAAMTYYGSKTIDLNGFTVTASNSSGVLFAPYVSYSKMTLQNSAENQGHYVCEYLQVYNDGTLAIPAENNNLTISAVLIESDGNANLAGGSFGKISVEGKKTLAGLLVSGYYFADTASGEPAAMYDADGTALTELTNVTVQPCSHNTAVCGSDGVWKCLCGQNVFVASVTKDGTPTYYTDLQNAFSAADGNTVKLMANVQDVTVNTDKPFTFDLNGYNVYLLTVNNKITIKDSATVKGKITEWLKVPSSMTVGELLEDGYAFKKSSGTWCSEAEQAGQAVGNVSIWPVPIRSVTAANPSVTVAYGQTSGVTLTATVVPFAEGGTYTCQWYKIGGTVSPLDGATDSTYQLPVDLAAGTYTYRLTATEDGYEKSCDFTVTVTPVSIEGAAVNVQSLTYNGVAQNPTATVTLGETVLTGNKDYTVMTTAQTNVGSYTLTVTGKGNYTGKIENVNWKIEPMQLYRFCDIEPVTKVYDGTAVAPIAKSALAFHDANARGASVTLPEDAYDITNARFTMRQGDGTYVESPEAGNGKSLSFTVMLKSGNYVFKGGTADVMDCDYTTDKVDMFTIMQDTISLSGIQFTQYVFNDLAKTYAIELKPLLDDILSQQQQHAGREYGDIQYGKPSVFMDSAYYPVGGATIGNDNLSLSIKKAASSTQGEEIGTVTVEVETTNYQTFTLTIHVIAKNKIVPVMDGTITASTITYGNELSASTITGTMKNPNTGDAVNGTFAWKDGTIKPAANDSYEAEWMFTPAEGYEEYATATGTVTIKVNKATPAFTAPTAQENLTYTGQGQALITAGMTDYGTMQYSLTEDGTYSQNIPTGTDAGKYTVWYRVFGDANHNNTTPASVVVSIGKKPLTITGVKAESKPYDGTTNADISSVTFYNVTLNRGTDYTVTASFNNASVGNGKNVTATVTLMEQTAKNYALEQSSFTTTGNITKAAAPDFTKETALTIINDCEKTYTVTLPTLPTLETPKEYGALTHEIGEIKLNDGYYTSGAKVENGKLTLPIQKNDVETTGSVGTVTVVIKSANYEDITLTVNVSAKNRITPTGTPTLSKNAITYGDALNTIALSGKLYDNVNNVDVDGTFEWVDGTHIPVVGNGTYAAEWIFEPTDTEKYLTVSGRSNITVEKGQQYGEISMAGYSYGGTPSTPTLTDRTGDPNAQVIYNYSAAGSGSVQTWNIENPPTLNAGTYRMFAQIVATDNYYEYNAKYCVFVVTKATPPYTKPTGLTAKYGQTLEDVTLPDGWSWMDSSESVGGASVAVKPFKAKFTPTDTANYNTVENIKLDVTVNKANGGNLKTVELEQKYTDASEHTYTPDWSGLPTGQTWSYSSEYSVNTGTNVTLTKQDFAADGSLLTYAISGGKAGDKITITLKASCDNYGDFTNTLNITLTEKDDQKLLTITGDTSVIYGEKLTLTTTGGSGTGAVTYHIGEGNTGEATIDPETGVLTPVKVGSVSVIAAKAGDNDYNDITSAPFVLMIEPATPSGEPNYTKITTSGKTLKDAALTAEGSTLNPNNGKLEWVDDKGNVLPDNTRVEANTTYKWRFTPDDDNYTALTGEVELYHKSSSGGGGSSGYSYYTIKATAGAGGSISPSGNVSVREGRDQTFTITPDKGYAVANVKIDGKSIGAAKSYTFENVSRTHTIEVIFMKANGNPQTGVFVDVATGSYYEDAVDWAVENGITKGTDDTHFSPDDICTRAQAVTFLWRAAGSPEPETRAMPFTDVPAGSYYYDAVLWAVENGITKGTSDTTFSPNMTCSRAQIVAFLWRSEKSPAAGTANPFADVKSTAYYADAVLWAVKENITKGTTNTTFSPDADCTRAQIVTFLWRCKK